MFYALPDVFKERLAALLVVGIDDFGRFVSINLFSTGVNLHLQPASIICFLFPLRIN